jgi:hypothetical protein
MLSGVVEALMARLGDIVFDAAHPASLARFWAKALDGYAVAPYDDEELARLRANGINGPEDGWITLADPEGNEFDVLPMN